MAELVAASPWPHRAKTALLLLGFAMLGVICALAIVLFNGWLALLLVLPMLFALVTLADFRIGVWLLLVVGTLSQLNLLPSIPGLQPFYYLIVAPIVPLGARFLSGKPVLTWLPRPLLLAYLLPICVAALIGTRYIHLTPRFLLAAQEMDSLGLWYYLRGFLIRPMLFLFAAWLIANAVRESRNREAWLWPVAIALACCAGIVLLIVALSGFDLAALSQNRAYTGGIGWHTNDLGMALAAGFGPLLFATTTLRRPVLRLFVWCVLGLTVVAIALTFSRGAFLAMLVVCTYYLAVRRRLMVLLAAALVAVAAIAMAPAEVKERLSTGLTSSDSRSGIGAVGRMDDQLTAGRVGMWRLLLPDVLESPLIGRGLQSMYWSTPVRHGQIDAGHPHNVYLRTLLDTGLLGSVLIGGFVVWLFRAFRRAARDPTVDEGLRGYLYGGSAAVLALMVHGLSGGNFMPSREQWFLWICFGFLLAYLRPAAVQAGMPSGSR